MSSFQIEQTSRVGDIDASAWDRSVDGCGVFLQHAWLSALEQSGAVGGDSGWSPLPLLARREGRAVGRVPLYLKSHSYGEYVFDWSWADAYRQAGLAYYPKLLAAIPFTPVTGPRFAGEVDAAAALMQTVEQMQDEHRIASAHVLFPPEEEALRLQQRGWLLRHGVQFHWQNRGYRDFEDFLETLERSKRKKIKQERRKVAEAGVTVMVKDGHQASREDWAFFTCCYNTTYREHRSSPYLNLDFFIRIGAELSDAVRLFIAERAGAPVAASLCLADGDKLYGRYWGALEDIPCLHFELCYYAGIELAIAEGATWFEGGAQGEHKLARGFLPVRTWSAHRLLDPRFSEAIARWLQRERVAMNEYERELLEHSAYKTGA